MLTEAQIEALRVQCGRVGVVEYNGHQIVFRKPTRDHCREYRRMRESANERHEALEHLAQLTIVAYDGTTEPNAARTQYTAVFLEEYPLFVNVAKVMNVLSVLAGLVEEEDAHELGKGASVRSGPPRSMPEGSPTGSLTSPTAPS
jgi:hypothetical protein